MPNKHLNITYAYHFLSEALIIFLIFLPIFHYQFEWVPYWIYLGIAIGLCLLFMISSRFTMNYSFYMIATIFIMPLFYFIGFPLELSILMPLILTWRFLNIRSQRNINREMTYLKLTLFLTVLFILLIKDIDIVIYGFIIFLNLIVGYIVSQLRVVKKDVRKKFDMKLWFYLMGFFILGAVVIISLFDYVRLLLLKAWEAVTYVLILIISQLGRLIKYINFELVPHDEEPSEEEIGESRIEDLLPEGGNEGFSEQTLTYIYWAILVVVISIIIFLVYRRFNNKFFSLENETDPEQTTYSKLDDLGEKKSIFKRAFGRLRRTPTHPVRKLIYQFERKAKESDYGRYSFETIEEWLERIDMDADFETYQKVRYGGQDVTSEDIEILKDKIQEINQKLG